MRLRCGRDSIGFIAACFVLSSVIGEAQGQSWPARPIKFIVSQAAGDTPDIVCRLITDKGPAASAEEDSVPIPPFSFPARRGRPLAGWRSRQRQSQHTSVAKYSNSTALTSVTPL